MNDDWRLQLQAADEGEALLLVERLGGPGPGHTLGTAFDDKVIVSREGAQVFLYAATREQVEAAGELAAKLAGENEWQVSSSLSRWHHESERWEDPDEPLPASAAERQAEHEELVSEERAEVAAGATPQWEVRVDLPSHGDARASPSSSSPRVSRGSGAGSTWSSAPPTRTPRGRWRAGSKPRLRPAARSPLRATSALSTRSSRPTRSRSSADSAARPEAT